MAHIRMHKDKWRVEVLRHGIRKSKVLPTYAEAVAWGEDQQGRLDGARARYLSESEAKTIDVPLLTSIPVTVLDAMRGIPHGVNDVILASVPISENIGIYFLLRGQEVVYVGQSIDVLTRIARHKREGKWFDHYTIMAAPEDQLDRLEAMYIRAFVPCDNISFGNVKPKKKTIKPQEAVCD